MRSLTPLDNAIVHLDFALRTVFGPRPPPDRPSPALGVDAPEALSEADRRLSTGLMRVNHAGEICAQALYQGQAITARDPAVRRRMESASREENDHLAWCEERLRALEDRSSRLNPLWYLGSLAIGVAAGLAGDRWSLGFLAETERQVCRHLDGHLQRLPAADGASRAVVRQMRDDEAQHARLAEDAGAAELPEPVKGLMALASRVMTRTAYHL